MLEIIEGIVATFIDMRCPERTHPSTFDIPALQSDVLSAFGVKIEPEELQGMSRQEIETHIYDLLVARYKEKEELIGAENMRDAERIVMLNVIDNQWKDHLLSMDELKQGIGNRAYGQKDPLVEYKKESYELFTAMMDRIEDESVRYLYFLQVNTGSGPVLPFPDEDEEEADEEEAPRPDPNEQQRQAAKATMEDFTRNIQRKKERELADLQFIGGEASAKQQPVLTKKKVGPNEPCYCGSGKKFKKCHGAA